MSNVETTQDHPQKELEYEIDIEKSTTTPKVTNDSKLSKRTSTRTSRRVPKLRAKKRTKEGGGGGGGGVKKKKKSSLLKYGSLVLLITQMVGLVLLMRYSRTSGKTTGKDGQLYLASTAVFMMELFKFLICLMVIFYNGGCSVVIFMSELHSNLWNSPYEVLKLCVPSLLYTVQNNLLYCALTNLDAATYQVCYQLKILTTALFSALLLKRKFSPLKWTSLFILTIGVIIVQNSGTSDESLSDTSKDIQEQNRLLGLICVLCAACTSGFSGVYFEKILKGSQTSLWIRNIQMGLPSLLIAFATVYIEDASTVSEKGFFVGYSSLVWLVISVQAAGGLIVAIVVKYADNVMKVFATSISIVVSCIVSAFVFSFRPSLQFCVGTLLVMTATVMYGRPEKKKKSILPTTRKEAKQKSVVM